MHIVLHLNEKLQPKHRFPLEDMIDETLKKNGLGEVTGGGTLMKKNGEIESCDIEIQFKDGDPNAEEWFKDYINSLNIAKESTLEIDNKHLFFVGNFEGMALYLKTNLPEDVYKNNDINSLISKLKETLGEEGVLRSWREHKDFTALYFYGRSFLEMKKLAKPVLNENPLAKGCKIVRIG